MPEKHPDTVGPRRPWSPYREEDQVVVSLPATELLGDDPPVAVEDDTTEGAWDPVMKVVYLSNVEEVEPAETLILETRRQAIDADHASS